MNDDDKLRGPELFGVWTDEASGWRMRVESGGRRTGKALAQEATERLWDGLALHWHRVGPAGLNEGHNCPPECTDGNPRPPAPPHWWEGLYDEPGYPETVSALIRRHRRRVATVQDLFLLHAVLRSGTFWIQWAWRAGYRGPLRGRHL